MALWYHPCWCKKLDPPKKWKKVISIYIYIRVVHYIECIVKSPKFLNFRTFYHSFGPELNFRSRILKFRLRLQKPRSFEASVGYIVINFHHFPLHFPCDSSEYYLFSIFVLLFHTKKLSKTKKLLLRKIVKMVRKMKKKMMKML